MNLLAERVLGVAKEYLGPASQQFLSRELRALGCTADTLGTGHIAALAERAHVSALRIMDEARATAFAEQLGSLEMAEPAPARPAPARAGKSDGGPLAAAAQLLADGKLRRAEEAYRQLAARHGSVAAYQGLARASAALEDVPAALLALRDGAGALTRNGDRSGAIALLAEAVGLAPGDLAAHRRLAAAHANAGDIVGACDEYARFVDHALVEGDPRRAWLELTYGRETLGDVPALLRITDRLMPAGLQAAAPPAAPPRSATLPFATPPSATPPSATPRLATPRLATPPPAAPPRSATLPFATAPSATPRSATPPPAAPQRLATLPSATPPRHPRRRHPGRPHPRRRRRRVRPHFRPRHPRRPHPRRPICSGSCPRHRPRPGRSMRPPSRAPGR